MEWVAILSAGLTPVIAIIALGIAYLQWKTNQENLKERLFDRRMHVYDVTVRYLYSVKRWPPDLQHQTNFHEARQKAQFLFESDVVDYLDRIRRSADTVQRTEFEERLEQSFAPRQSRGDLEAQWLDGQIDECHLIFGKYMKFKSGT